MAWHKSRQSLWSVRAPFVILLTIGTLVLLAVIVPSPDGQAIAAWVQAGGSMLAIYGAYQVGAKQSQAAIEAVMEAQRVSTRNRKIGQFAVVQAALTHAQQIGAALGNDDSRLSLLGVYDKIVTQRISKALASIPTHEVGSEAGVRALLSMADQFLLLERALEVYLAGPWEHPQLRLGLEQYQGPEFQKLREELIATGMGVLAGNARRHLKRISDDHDSVKDAMFMSRVEP
jgi:hypothetical protein